MSAFMVFKEPSAINTPYFVNLHDHLRRDLEKTLEQEELLWHQKSREQWLHYGNRNQRESCAFLRTKNTCFSCLATV